MCLGAIMVFIPVFAYQYLQLSVGQIGIVISVNILTTALMQIPACIIADKYDRRLILIASGSIFSLMLFLLPLIHSFFHLLVLSLLSGIPGE